MRGSNALTAAVDIVLELERAPSSIGASGRVLRAVSRYSVAPGDVVLTRNGDGAYEAHGAVAVASAAAELNRVVAELHDGGSATAEELAGTLGLSKPTVQRHLNTLRKAGRLQCSGAGRKGDPFLWRSESDATEEISSGRIESAARSSGIDPKGPPSQHDSTQPPIRIESPESSESNPENATEKELEQEPMLRALETLVRSDGRWLDGEVSR